MLCGLGGGGKEKKERKKGQIVFSKEAAVVCLCLSLCKGVYDSWEKHRGYSFEQTLMFNLKWFLPETVFS